jgi:signal transduction histidine kinase
MADVVIHSGTTPDPRLVAALQAGGLHVRSPGDDSQPPVHLLDLPLADALAFAADNADFTAVLVLGQADLPAALPHLGTAFADLAVRPITDAELVARVRAVHSAATHDSLRSRSLRIVAHDVNNPLTAIRLLAEMLAGEMSSPEATQDMQDILEASDLAAAYVESLSALTKLDGASAPAHLGPVDVGALLTAALRRPCMRRHVASSAPTEPLVIRADKGALQQAILDVLLTARRLTEGSGTCRATALEHDGAVIITVDATGARIPDELVPHLLVPYGAAVLRDARIQVAPAGLAHAHAAAQRLGGSLRIVPGPSGVHFHLRLPRGGAT